MKTSTYLSAYVKCESRKNGSIRKRPKGLVGIAVNTDGWVREWQRLDRISYKCLDKVRARLIATDALAAAMEELLEVYDDNEYIPDSFTFQPFRKALRQYREAING